MAKKILVVDDDPSVVKTLTIAFEKFGYEVDSANNGGECLKKVILDTPDLIILDIMMPKADGYDFLVSFKQIRALGAQLPEIPILVITGKDSENVRDLVCREDIKGYFTKPFDLKELFNKVEELLKE